MSETGQHERHQWLVAMAKGKPFPSDEHKIRALIRDADRLQRAEELLNESNERIKELLACEDNPIAKAYDGATTRAVARKQVESNDAFLGESHD